LKKLFIYHQMAEIMAEDQPLCNGMMPTNMRMSGLSWHLRQTDDCIVWLFEGLVMDTMFKLICGLFGCFGLGAFQGWLLYAAGILRKKHRRELGLLNLTAYCVCYFLLLVNGYLLMYLAMSGWIPMLLVTVAGIVVGNVMQGVCRSTRSSGTEIPLLQTQNSMCENSGELIDQTPCGC